MKRSPTEELILEVLAARHRLGEPWWTFSRNATVAAALVRLSDQGLIEIVNDTQAALTEAGRESHLLADWKPAHVRAKEDLADNVQDSSGMRWWYEQADRFGLSGYTVRGMAATAEASIRKWGRLIPVADWPRWEAMLGGDQ